MTEVKELGTLVVVVGKARNLPNKSRFGKQDPFATVAVGEDKQRTKPIKRGGQHPEWDEELRFTIHEDLDDVLLRSESQSDSLNSSVSSKNVAGDMGQLTPSTTLGALTPAQLASKSRKGPLGKKGGKSMKVACFADDAKEPELIGEVVVPIDEVLKKGEVDEWYEFTYKDKYSGEIYLELTFYSNDAPPVKRNVPRPAILPSGSIYDSFASSSSSSINGHSRAGGLSTSGSVSGMSLYIPPYVQPSRVSTPQPPPPISAPPAMAPSNSFADLGVPPGHRHRQSMTTLPSQPSYPPNLMPGSSSAIDALSRPFSSLSLTPSASSSRPLPSSSTPAPQLPHVPSHNYGNHRHSLGGPADAPWSSMLPNLQPKPPAASQSRPFSAQEANSWDQVHRLEEQRRQGGATPVPRPESSMTQSSSYSSYSQQQQPPPRQQSYESSAAYRSTTPTPYNVPSSLQPHVPSHTQPKPHAHSFSGTSRPIVPPPNEPPLQNYAHLHPQPPPLTHASSAPPAPAGSMPGHYQVPTSSYSLLSQPVQAQPQRSPSPQPGYPAQIPPHDSIPFAPHPQSNGAYDRPPSRNNSFPPSQLGYNNQDHQTYNHSQTNYEPDRSHTPRPTYPQRPPPSSAAPPHQQNASTAFGYPQSSSAPPLPPAPAPAPTSQSSYVPWYQQTQPVQQPNHNTQHADHYQQQLQQSAMPGSYQPQYQASADQAYQPVTSPPPVPAYRPAPHPPPPRQAQSSVGYYPSDELYAEQQRSVTPQPPPSQPQHSIPPQSQPWQQQQQQYPQQSHPPIPPQTSMFSPPPPQHHQTYPPASTSPPRAPSGWHSTVGQYTSTSPAPAPLHPPQPQSYHSSPASQSYAQAPIPGRIPSPVPPPSSNVQQAYNTNNNGSGPQNGWSGSASHIQPPPLPSSQSSNQAAYQRSASPLPTQIGQDWKSYMKSLNTPSSGAGPGTAPLPGRTPSPQPPTSTGAAQYGYGQPPGNDTGYGHGQSQSQNQNQSQNQGQGQGQGQSGSWYTPPPSLPTSIRPPDGWRSTLPTQAEGHQWRG